MLLPLGLLISAQAALLPPMTSIAGPIESYAFELKRACMSDAGIAIAAASWGRWLAETEASRATSNAIETELGLAAYSTPIDVDRLERAARARDADQARRLVDSLTRSFDVMRKLSPNDRAIFARRLSVRQPMTPVKTCQP
jgi:hypothetical protein